MIANSELFYEPIQILSKLSKEYTAEMQKGQLAFLCGLIKKYRPEKIVEIGVAAGGTTAVMLNCINMLSLKTQLFSVDLLENFYENPCKKTGYLAEECKGILNMQFDYMLYTGKYAVERMDDIGKDIDFLVLDTVHVLPGELLDFLAYYPYLKEGCVVVLHDTAMNQYGDNKDAFATRILFSSVAALKMFYEDANIAAFIVSRDTTQNIDNVFSALMVTWKYLPGPSEINLYRDAYNKYYTSENLKMFDMALEMNKKSVLRKANLKLDEFLKIYKLINGMNGKRVYVYGHGNYGRQFYQIFAECGIDLGGYIISDSQNIEGNDTEIHHLSDIVLDNEHDVIFVGVNSSLWEEISEQLEKMGIANYIFPEECMFEYLTNF